MTVSDLARRVTLQEGLKKSISIAQVCEVFKLVNIFTKGAFYKLIRSL